MYCKECGAEIPDDSKHCKECGANLKEDVETTEINKTSEPFYKKHKKGLACIIGVIIIFIIIGGLISFSDRTDADLYIRTGIADALTEEGYSPAKYDMDKNNCTITYDNDNGDVVVYSLRVEDSDEFQLFVDNTNNSERVINNITGYVYYYNGTVCYTYYDNNNSVLILTGEDNEAILDKIVKDY